MKAISFCVAGKTEDLAHLVSHTTTTSLATPHLVFITENVTLYPSNTTKICGTSRWQNAVLLFVLSISNQRLDWMFSCFIGDVCPNTLSVSC